MATKVAQRNRQFLPPDELEQVRDVYEPGAPLLWVMGFGWGYVGYYVRHINPLQVLVAHCNHFRNAGKDYGRLAQEGAGPECEWRYEGTKILTVPQIISVGEYFGEVPHQTQASGSD